MKKSLVILLLCGTVGMWADEIARPLRVGMLLPLQAQAPKRDKNMDRFVDFYSGALLAVYEMQATGQQVEIHTWDVGKSTAQLQTLLNGDELNTMDMIIGPVYASQVRLMAPWVMQHKVKTLLPFSSDVPELAGNPYLMQFNPTYAAEAEVMAENLASETGVRFIFVESDDMALSTGVKELQQSIRSFALEYVYTTVSEVMADSLSYYLMDGVENVLLLNSERYANLRVLMPYITRAAQGKQLTLLSHYAWQTESIILPQVYTSVFRQDLDTVVYNRLYAQFYSTARSSEHPCYDLLGYDLMKFTLNSIQSIRRLDGIIDEEDILCRYFCGLQSDIQFERVGEQGGYQNAQIYCIKRE